MIIVRRILLEIRKINGQNTVRNILLELLGALALLTGAYYLDITVPFTFFWLAIRSILILFSGLGFFAVLYTISNMISDSNLAKDPDYLILRKRFTYNQRKNYGMLFGIFIFLQVLITVKGSFYSVMSVLQIIQILTVLSFVRSMKAEFIKKELGLPDIKDIRYNKEIQEKIAERKRKRKEKKEKSE